MVFYGHCQHLRESYEKWVGLSQEMHQLSREKGVFQGHSLQLICDFFMLMSQRMSSTALRQVDQEREDALEQYLTLLQLIVWDQQQWSEGQLLQTFWLGLKQSYFGQSMHSFPLKKGVLLGQTGKFQVLLENRSIVQFYSSKILSLAAAQLVNRIVPERIAPLQSQHCLFQVLQTEQLKQLCPCSMKQGLYLGHCLHLPSLSAQGTQKGQTSTDGCAVTLFSYWLKLLGVVLPSAHRPAFKLLTFFDCCLAKDCSLPVLKQEDYLIFRNDSAFELKSRIDLYEGMVVVLARKQETKVQYFCLIFLKDCWKWELAMGLKDQQVQGVLFKLQWQDLITDSRLTR